MKKKESFAKVQDETFFTSPPYSYRPSIAEYLTTGKTSRLGFIADIMHLDHKKNIKITELNDYSFKIRILNKDDINLSERLIIDYLESLKKDGEIEYRILFTPKSLLYRYYSLVRIKSAQRFRSGLLRYKNDNEDLDSDYNKYFKQLIIKRFIIGLLVSLIGLVNLIFLFLGIIKMLRQPKNISYFSKNFIKKYFSLIYLYFFFYLSVFFALGLILTSPHFAFIILGFMIIIPLWMIILYVSGSISSDYFDWVFESNEAEHHRNDWFRFKQFVIDHSELENHDLKYYKLWGPFYYYTLAVGGNKIYSRK